MFILCRLSGKCIFHIYYHNYSWNILYLNSNYRASMCIALINKMSGNEQKGSEILSVPNDYFFTVAQHWPPVMKNLIFAIMQLCSLLLMMLCFECSHSKFSYDGCFKTLKQWGFVTVEKPDFLVYGFILIHTRIRLMMLLMMWVATIKG